ncbi:hypothetical protein A2773_01680 [Candidatus Gottesmanbacteria bacterium RIFCSPHIGHO2_01_FULL_39_10]|uniref:Uncharacterized protein n=1 Tax=Candidatus Gottesmanbacteria bacterium RIFCSPHIGHO2_01_FULL_39_10 TaxID=1798375 RepID=A0A1F5ZK80_9BACT|nr:MAG: hypothetical protein A2773_01680 [Candidatus Gottesmanbacteria bacterium RIFCSPHIGHO2_01_FULL_39_10]
MTEKKPLKKVTQNSTSSGKSFSDEERAAIKERALELRNEARASKNKAEGEKTVLAAIAQMPQPDQVIAKRVHEIVKATAPELSPKTWYGMPAYANKDGKVVCFFQAASKFKYRYATLGFQEDAHLDAGDMWPVSFALKKLTAAEEEKIARLVKKAIS